ncbi:MAG: hypothetical protein BWY67_02126 [Bacteroidetes bacterium ADurb.Bin397]|nr:MAG: hypothetical protein BWY67_02126 [Bacteroidetes bacterium ADurb.Bin397]
MKKQTILAIAVAVFTAISFSANAQHDHKAGENHQHTSPHGGVVKTAGNYHIELVQTKDKTGNVFTIYLLDTAEKTISNKGKSGVLFIQTADANSSQETLLLAGDDKFVFTYKGKGDIINAIVSIKWGEETATAKFQWKAAPPVKKEEHQHNDGHNHQH